MITQVDQHEIKGGFLGIHEEGLFQSPLRRFFFVTGPEHQGHGGVGQPVICILQIGLFYGLAHIFSGHKIGVQADDIAKGDPAQMVVIGKLCIVFLRILGHVLGSRRQGLVSEILLGQFPDRLADDLGMLTVDRDLLGGRPEAGFHCFMQGHDVPLQDPDIFQGIIDLIDEPVVFGDQRIDGVDQLLYFLLLAFVFFLGHIFPFLLFSSRASCCFPLSFVFIFIFYLPPQAGRHFPVLSCFVCRLFGGLADIFLFSFVLSADFL